MNIHSLTIPLKTTNEQVLRLQNLQHVFAEICNALAPIVQETKCWNRVALHHMMYRSLREQFPQVGSQMVCNAIYSVCRTSRMVFQAPQSPFNLQKLQERPLPLLKFLSTSPVYFDRHTLNIKPGFLSMYTLDGRMRFDLELSELDFNRFKTWKLHEVVLNSVDSQFTLNFSFVNDKVAQVQSNSSQEPVQDVLPEYILVQERVGALASQTLSEQMAFMRNTAAQDGRLQPITQAPSLQTTTVAFSSSGQGLRLAIESQDGFAKQVHSMPQGLKMAGMTQTLQLNLKFPVQQTAAVQSSGSANQADSLNPNEPHTPGAHS